MAVKRKTKKSLAEISQTHAKVEKFKPTTLDQIWGSDGLSKYSTLNYEEYKESLRKMDKSKMQAHAIELGLVPIDNTAVLNERLLTEFRLHIGQFVAVADERPEKQKKVSEEVLKILREGA
jgi:hypothetical protein